ncbi:MAG: cupin domain-containing protein [Chitinophagaceae bacterium]
MKNIYLFAAMLCTLIVKAQTPSTTTNRDAPVQSDVYAWKNLPIEKKATSERRQILDGSGPVLSNLEIHATTIDPGTAPHAPHHHEEEELFIIKEGSVTITINGKSQVLGAGSVAVAMPGEEHGMLNTGKTKATYYVIKYKSRDSVQHQRATNAGGSFMINWDTVTFRPHDKGGLRKFTERPTAMLKRFEMHVTTLNAGIKSHDPHTHKAEEIVLLIDGHGEMQIGDKFKKVEAGDLVFLGSNVLHAIRNDNDKTCTYFAFQFE